MALAGQIQASFLPREVPEMAGWQFAATLMPARETSGDFYDFVPLPNGRWGIVVADVADKGMGAALYMALSCTLIRTYAAKHHTRPDLVFSAASRRILTDTRSDLFVSVFYGILDPSTGTLNYCNAGHNPPLLLRGGGGEVQELRRTGMFLGVMSDATWERATAQMSPGDVLLLYTDGITDAQNRQGEFFGDRRLHQALRASPALSARGIHDTLVATLHDFVGDTPQFDDITLMVVVRT
jgi:sigma-B regulation protein RsbU (phosphoserine phosphatase)